MVARKRGYTMATDLPRFTITVDEDMMEFIDEFQFQNRYPNRNMAVNEILLAGAAVLKGKQPDKTPKHPRRRRKS